MRLQEYVTLIAVLLLLLAGMFFFRRTLSDALIEALSHFRGGPRPAHSPIARQ